MATKLYVGNLDYGVRTEELREFFAQYGELEDAIVLHFSDTGRSRGFGFVTFVNEEDANKAIEATDGVEWYGRELKVNVARPREERPPRRSNYGGGYGNSSDYTDSGYNNDNAQQSY